MAHGDYKCCAVCDSKQEYIGLNDSFKDDICPACRLETGIATVGKLKERIDSFNDKNELIEWLEEIDMQECHYGNEVDSLIATKLGYKSDERWQKRK